MPNATTLSQFSDEKQALKNLKKIIFGTQVRCSNCNRKRHVVELKKNKLWRELDNLY